MSPQDTDDANDLYLRDGGATTLLSVGSDGGNGAIDVVFGGVGSGFLFETRESLVSQDTDMAEDVYQWYEGTVELRSTGPGGTCAAGASECPAHFLGAGGQEVFFSTSESFSAQDTDTERDIYQGGFAGTTLVSTGPQGICPFSGCVPLFRAVSNGGSRIVFETDERLVSQDMDSARDVYVRSFGITELVSTGPNDSSDQSFPAPSFGGMSEDGSRIFFHSYQNLTDDDTDPPGGCPTAIDGDLYELNCADVFERDRGLTTLVSEGPLGASGAYHAIFEAASESGEPVVFATQEQLTATDTDDRWDLHAARFGPGAPYVRPAGASPFRVSLVPAFRACTGPNREHGPPLAFGSCTPPQPASPMLTVGVGDGSPAFSRSVGYMRLAVTPGVPGPPDDTDVRIRFSLSNVMRVSDLSEYTGELRATFNVRLTDRYPTLTTEFPFAFDVPCVGTEPEVDKSLCEIATSFDAVFPGGAAPQGTRAIWGLDQVEVFDGGPDGDGATTDNNSLFAVQGVYVP